MQAVGDMPDEARAARTVIIITSSEEGDTTVARIHDCTFCTCNEELCAHCEGHFEEAQAGNAYVCRPCYKKYEFTSQHHEERDYDGSWFCTGCVLDTLTDFVEIDVTSFIGSDGEDVALAARYDSDGAAL